MTKLADRILLVFTYGLDMLIENITLIVQDYDRAISFFVDALGFEVVEDSPATSDDGRPKRWVVVRPPSARSGLLLAQADGDRQSQAVGDQFAGRVGLFLRVDDFEQSRRRMLDHGVEFVTEPRDEPYGRVAVFLDVEGNRWDLLGPADDR
jgi:catechol 2,3-dioxygenase-like lactoylglutathione lyase family enzyme